jgi:hypothetical protein
LDYGLGQDQGRQDQQEQIFHFDEGIIVTPVIGKIDDEPKSGQEKGNDSEDYQGEAPLIDVKRAHRTHGAGKKWMEGIGGVNKQEEGKKLENQGIADYRGDKVGFSFQP